MSPVATSTAAGPNVGIGQIAVSADSDVVISALGLGSCIGVVFIDPRARMAGMAHVMLPESPATPSGPPGKFADLAIPALLDQMRKLGADQARLVVKMAGGAQMFGASSGGNLLRIGERNAEAVTGALSSAGLRVRSSHIGGNSGRTMAVTVGTGSVTVRTVGGDLVEL